MRTEPMRWVKYDPDDLATHPRDGKWAVVAAPPVNIPDTCPTLNEGTNSQDGER